MPAVDRGIDNEEEEEDLRRRTSPPSRGAVAASVAVEREEEHQGAKARSPSTPTSPTGAGGVKTSSDWMSLFLGSKSGRGLESKSIYSSKSSNSVPSASASAASDMYDRPGSRYTSRYSSSSSGGGSSTSAGTSYGSRYYSSATSGYLNGGGSGGGGGGASYSRTFSSVIRSPGTYSSPYSSRRTRLGRRREDEDDRPAASASTAKDETDTAKKEEPSKDESDNGQNGARRKKKKNARSTVINGNVIRITKKEKGRGSSGNSESSTEEESETESEKVLKAANLEMKAFESFIFQLQQEEETPPPPPKTPTPPPPPPPPEDPLDVEERMLKAQLALSFTLTMTDEENIRQRMLEIKKARIKRANQEIEQTIINRFEKESDQLAEPTRAKEEEEKILITRLSAETLREVEQKDIQVRLQEIFRDRKAALEVTLKHMETHYEHLLQENSTEMCELDSSIRNKQAAVDKIQEEMLSLTVRKELLSSGMEKINHRHQEQLEQVGCQQRELDTKISQYAVLAPPPCSRKAGGSVVGSEELRELEEELECPVCMDISRPPIYQCEEGHIICSACKPLLTQCPHCGKNYCNPVIRCRFAEKLAERYFKMVDQSKEEGGKEEEKEGKKEEKKDMHGLDLLQ